MDNFFFQADPTLPQKHPLLSGLATVLPLSALIDFIDTRRALHLFELTGRLPLWCWTVAPAGRRLLVSELSEDDNCLLDRFGNSQPLVCIDGRYGDEYCASNPETLRMAVATAKATVIVNDHPNMDIVDKRPQKLDVIRASRSSASHPPLSSGYRVRMVSTFGWLAWVFLGILAYSSQLWLSLSFLAIVPLTGMVISLARGGPPPELRIDESASQYNRLVVVTRHMNDSEWQVFYGESTLVNRLLNWPLKTERSALAKHWILRVVLQALIFGQWILAVASAVYQTWDAFFIGLWVFVSLFSTACVFTSRETSKVWVSRFSKVKLDRVTTHLSSRRALLNTITALNPDTFVPEQGSNQLSSDGTHWIDPILKNGVSRTRWEEATRLAMTEMSGDASESLGGSGEGSWRQLYANDYWSKFIPEGIIMARKIKNAAQLGGRMVEEPSSEKS